MKAPLHATPGAAEQALRRLEWTVLRRLDGLLQGDYRTLLRGTGLDLADLRPYQLHDDVRHIDWNVTARLQQPHVRVHTEERNMSAWFLLDLSASMDFGSGRRRKREQLADFVAMLARVLTRHGNRVGALLYDQRLHTVLPAAGGRRHVLQLLDLLQRHAATPRPPAGAGLTRLQDLLAAAGGMVRRRSTLFVLSDFLSAPGWSGALAQLAQRHEVVAVRLYDPLEQDLPDLGLLPLRDPETGATLLVDTGDAALRARYARLAAQRAQAVHAQIARAGVDAMELASDEDLLAALLRLTALRRQRLRGPRARLPAHLHPVPAPAVEAAA